ncbi:BglG family transcription antiterminator [Virgibacillus senegalensis]|uniref:BglG family transcription antiterminator n=1 Tax=Virgibacillus senegalensis TaxID=1499679 RepID=UPI00069E4B7A|nr:PRD domain-containing protein [Virgibacillus senegalensis]
MFITSREKSIIELIVKTSGKHTAQSLASFLNVSVRTIQRDLKSAAKFLDQFQLNLNRTPADGLVIDGKNEHIYRLMQHLSSLNPTDETPEERKLHLLITLLHEGVSFKTQVLAKQLGVSTATLTTYLNDLAVWLEKFGVTLSRKRGVGVELIARESDKRKALAGYFSIHFHEELIEYLYLLQKGNQLNGLVFGYFSPQYLQEIDSLVSRTINKGQTRLADSDYIGLIIHMCITVQRSESQYRMEQTDQMVDKSSLEYRRMKQMCEDLIQKFDVPLTENDVLFLTVMLKGSKLQRANSIGYDSIMLGRLIKDVISDVSNQLHIYLSDDFSLFQGLLAHMEPSLFRLQQGMELFNPLTDEIKRKYPVLFMAVKNSLETHFQEVHFPDEEVAFIVLHFGSALLMNEEKAVIQAVVVCPTGIGASKMLASRIQQEVPEIEEVEILSINDFRNANLSSFDVVISTVRLPFSDLEYILVSPLLSEEDTEAIHDFLKRNLKKLTGKKQYIRPANEKETSSHTEKQGIHDLLEEIKDVHSSIEGILANLRVYRYQDTSDHREVLRKMVEQAEEDQLLDDSNKVLVELEERENRGGLGIPNTNMGLFHCRDDHIHELIFQVSHLEQPCTIKGMDGQEVQMKNLLLMLAPDSMSLREQEVLSLISTSLIENDVAMMIFSSSNEAMIRKKLEDLFLDYLQNNLIKE